MLSVGSEYHKQRKHNALVLNRRSSRDCQEIQPLNSHHGYTTMEFFHAQEAIYV